MMKRIYLSPPHVGPEERALLLEAFDSNWVAPVGPDLDAFEREVAALLGDVHTAALSSGTAALHLALILLGVGPGDEVLVPTLTFAASANVVRYVGALPVFVDCDTYWTVDPVLVQTGLEEGERRGKLPKAVMTVDLFGQCADYDRLGAICARYGVPMIQDAAEALGSRYRGAPAGTQGDISVLSFNGNKIITTSGGGMLVSARKEWIDRARFLATQARDPAPHYEHSEIGYNYRLSNLLAAVGRAQLAKLEQRVLLRRANFDFYREALGSLPGWSFMPEAPYGTSNRWLTCVTIDPAVAGVSRERIRHHLAEHQVEARPVWKPMHCQPAFRGCRVYGGSRAERIFEQGLCLPSGSGLLEEERMHVTDLVQEVAASHRP
ncbi:MAG: aminotransferase class I/II-fold pyridoxal phosphate-dependent enzyme [Polyangiaceae bacterium]|nr:aminotransferase class I/II-fold pyridoxal phosphate-dependent enzyme [Polyangiaceae bacterium]